MPHEFDGKKYETASTHQKEWGARLIEELNLKGSEHVLDLGCGDGALTRKIADRVPKGDVLGIDASQGMIDAALPKLRPNLHFRKLDMRDLDFDNQFDLIFSNAALHWVSDHHLLLKSVYRALRMGGFIRFQFAGEGNCAHFEAVIREAIGVQAFQKAFVKFQWPWFTPSVDAYSRLAESIGLRCVRVWGENADRYFPDVAAMIQWIDQPGVVPFLAMIAEHQRASFRDFVVRRMIEKTRQKDGRCFETFRRINVAAMKQDSWRIRVLDPAGRSKSSHDFKNEEKPYA